MKENGFKINAFKRTLKSDQLKKSLDQYMNLKRHFKSQSVSFEQRFMILLQEKLIWRSSLFILILQHHNFLAFSTGWFSIYFLLLRDSENDLLVN